LALGSTGTTINLEYGRQLIFGLIEGTFKFAIIEGFEGFLVGGFYFFFAGFAFFLEIEQNGCIIDCRSNLMVEIYPVFVLFDFLEDSRGALIIIPESGR
jgi:hypothetical protein